MRKLTCALFIAMTTEADKAEKAAAKAAKEVEKAAKRKK